MARPRREAAACPPRDPLSPPPERFAHGELISETVTLCDDAGKPQTQADIWRERAGVPLDRYARRGEISSVQFQAGDRLRALAYRAGLEARLTQRFSPLPGSGDPCGHLPPSEAAARARAAYRAALAAVGPVLSPVLIAVCIDDRAAGDWAKAQRRPAAHGLPTLICGLDSLILHWRMG